MSLSLSIQSITWARYLHDDDDDDNDDVEDDVVEMMVLIIGNATSQWSHVHLQKTINWTH